MGLKEILAAKKAAAEAEANKVGEEKNANETNTTGVQADAGNVATAAPTVSPLDIPTLTEVIAKPIEAEVAAPVEGKTLSFAEKMALKKQQIAAAQSAPPVKAEAKPAVEIDPNSIPEDPLDAQAYVDIKTRIIKLEDMMEDDLKGAMTELKAALKKNPNAALLMLDTDVGKMVSALRRITHVAQVEAETGKKPGRKAKAAEVKLTADQIAAAFEEL